MSDSIEKEDLNNTNKANEKENTIKINFNAKNKKEDSEIIIPESIKGKTNITVFWEPKELAYRRHFERVILIKLIEEGFDKSEIFKIMKFCPVGKWNKWDKETKLWINGSDPDYKDLQYEMAFIELFQPENIFKGYQDEIIAQFKGDKDNDVKPDKSGAYHRITDIIITETDIITNEITEEIEYYRDGIFRPGGELFVKKLTKMALGTYYKNSAGVEVIELVKLETSKPSFISTMYDDLICLDNGVLDISEGIVMKHSPNFYLREKIPVSYDKEGNEEPFLDFIESILPGEENKDYRQTLIELMAYCLMRKVPIHRFFIFVGHGRNGKSTFLNLLSEFLGYHNLTSIAMGDLRERFKNAAMTNKLANIHDDLPITALYDTGRIKELTGGKKYHNIEGKGKDEYSGKIFCKQIFACNREPQLFEDTDALWERVDGSIITFNQRFDVSNKKTDPYILEKLTAPEVKSGILNVLIRTLPKLLAKGTFSSSRGIEESRRINTIRINHVKAYGDERLDFTLFGTDISKNDLYQDYRKWCIEKNIQTLSMMGFTKALKENFYIEDTRRKDKRYWVGIGMKKPKETHIRVFIMEILGDAMLSENDIVDLVKEKGEFEEQMIRDLLKKLAHEGEIMQPKTSFYQGIS